MVAEKKVDPKKKIAIKSKAKVETSVIEEVKPKNKGGRPSLCTKELADEICRKISTSTIGLRALRKLNPHWPDQETIFGWRLDHQWFANQYATAKFAQAELFAEEIIEISDDSRGEEVPSGRLRTDSRKWIASKLLPKVYGDTKNFEAISAQKDETIAALRAQIDAINKKMEKDF